MRKEKIAFSGFMTAILLSVGVANAAAPQIASKAYVDDMGKTKSDVTFVGDSAGLADSGVSATTIVGAIKELKGITESLPNDSNFEEMRQDLAGKADKLTEVGTNAGNIATVDENGQYQVSTTNIDSLATDTELAGVQDQVTTNTTNITNMPTTLVENQEFVTNITNALDLSNKADKLTAEQVGANAGNIATVGADGQYTVSATSIDSLATDADVTTATANMEITTNKTQTIDAAAIADTNKYTSAAAVANYALPKPASGMNCDTDLCVLSTDMNGNLTWTNVTDPVGETTTGEDTGA